MRSWLRLALWSLAMAAAMAGCASRGKPSKKSAAAAAAPQQIQRATMAFASRYMAATAEVYDDILKNTSSPEVELAAIRGKLVAGSGAVGCAVETNPLLGLMDMAVLVRLSRGIAERPASAETFGRDYTARLVATMKNQEDDVWAIAAVYLTPEQMGELARACEEWLAEHPNQRYATNVELTHLAKEKRAGAKPGQLVSGVFGLITLDPFNGLDPAVREVELSRVLAERLFFYLRHMPMLLTWQTNSLYLQLLDAPQSKQLLAEATVVAGSTTRFSDITNRISDSIENFRLQLPKQQAALVEQLNQTIATQRDLAIKQATTQLSSHQETMSKNLHGLTDASIDRLYARARSLVLITVGAVLAAMCLYRLMIRPRAADGAGPKPSA